MPKSSKAPTGKSYRQYSDQLAELLAWFESEDLDLDQATVKYEQALELITKMEKHLKTAENSVRKVSAKFK